MDVTGDVEEKASAAEFLKAYKAAEMKESEVEKGESEEGEDERESQGHGH